MKTTMDALPATTNSFDARAAIHRLVIAVGCAIAACVVVIAALLALAGSAAWWRGFAAASIAGSLAAAISIVPLSIGLQRGYTGLMNGFLISTAVRFVVSIGIAAFAVAVGGYPKTPTLMLVLPFYIATLVAEAWSVTTLASSARIAVNDNNGPENQP